MHADQVAGNYLVGRRNGIGLACPMHCASNGKVLLAYWPEAEIERYLAKPLEQITEHTITDPVRLREELAGIRRQGRAWGLEELEIGLVGVSPPVFTRDQKVVASVNVSGPREACRFPVEKRPELARLTTEAASRITDRLQRSGRS